VINLEAVAFEPCTEGSVEFRTSPGPKGRDSIVQVEGLGFEYDFAQGLKGLLNCEILSDSTFQALWIFGPYPGLRPGLK